MRGKWTKAALAGLTLVTVGLGQSPSRPVFDVTSVRPNNSGDAGSSRSNLLQRGGRVTLVKFSLRLFLGQAYDLPSLSDAFDRIFGMPNWGDSDAFDIEARAEGNPDTSQKRLMLQSLLADRFKLVLHRETRQRPVYALVMVKAGKFGPQLQPHTDNRACEPQPAPPGPAVPKRSPGVSAAGELQRFSCGRVVGSLLPEDRAQVWSGGRQVTMATLAASLGGMEMFDRPIIDRTGVGGTFDFTVVWHVGLGTFSTQPAAVSGTSLLEALEEQLGLKLVAQTGPVEVLVIDHVEKPTLN